MTKAEDCQSGFQQLACSSWGKEVLHIDITMVAASGYARTQQSENYLGKALPWLEGNFSSLSIPKYCKD